MPFLALTGLATVESIYTHTFRRLHETYLARHHVGLAPSSARPVPQDKPSKNKAINANNNKNKNKNNHEDGDGDNSTNTDTEHAAGTNIVKRSTEKDSFYLLPKRLEEEQPGKPKATERCRYTSRYEYYLVVPAPVPLPLLHYFCAPTTGLGCS